MGHFRTISLKAMPGDRVEFLRGATWNRKGVLVSVRTEWFTDGEWTSYGVFDGSVLAYVVDVNKIKGTPKKSQFATDTPAGSLNMARIDELLSEIAGDAAMMPKTQQLIAQLTTELEGKNEIIRFMEPGSLF